MWTRSTAPGAGRRTLAAVYDLLTGAGGASLEAIAQQLPAGHPAKPCFNTYLQSSDSVRAGAITGLAGRLQTLQNGAIRSITSYPEIDLTLPGKELCAYFCITSDQDSTFEFLSSLFFSFLFIKSVRFADSCPGGQLPVPVHILGEELNLHHPRPVSQKARAAARQRPPPKIPKKRSRCASWMRGSSFCKTPQGGFYGRHFES